MDFKFAVDCMCKVSKQCEFWVELAANVIVITLFFKLINIKGSFNDSLGCIYIVNLCDLRRILLLFIAFYFIKIAIKSTKLSRITELSMGCFRLG